MKCKGGGSRDLFLEGVFWIQVHKLPLEILTRSNAEKIRRILRDLESIDDPIWMNGV